MVENKYGANGDAFYTKPYFWLIVILFITFINGVTAIFGISDGQVDIFSHLFYIPIILTAYFYPKYGTIAAFLIGTFFIILTVPYVGTAIELSQVLILAALFVGVGGIVSLISMDLYSQKQKYQSIFNYSGSGIFLVNCRNRKVLETNPSALLTLHYMPEEIVDETFDQIWKNAGDMEIFLEKIRSKSSVKNFEAVFSAKDGALRYVILSGKMLDEELVLCTMNDLTERKHAEELVKKSEIYFRTVFEKSPVGIAILDEEGTITQYNQALLNIFRLQDATGINGFMIFALPGIDTDIAEIIKEKKVVQSRISISVERLKKILPYSELDQDLLELEMDIVPFSLDEKGMVLASMAMVQDITSDVKAQTALFESQQRYQALFDFSGDPIIIHDPEGYIIEVNQMALKILGYTDTPFPYTTMIELLDSSCYDQFQDALWQIKEQGCMVFEAALLSADRNIIPVEISSRLFFLDEEPAILSTARNIAERKDQEKKLKTSLSQKEILLKEVHHRVKNNMQVISSLIQLQSGAVADPTAISQFDEFNRRVRSMAMVHEFLYQSEDLASINAEQYIRKLVNDITGSLEQEVAISTKIQVKNINLDISTAIPCGLILNELVTNAIKYAFKGKESGKLEIFLNTVGDSFQLMVRDDGIGLPDSFDLSSSTTLGMQLVNVLVLQLDGTIQISGNDGACFLITFPISRK